MTDDFEVPERPFTNEDFSKLPVLDLPKVLQNIESNKVREDDVVFVAEQRMALDPVFHANVVAASNIAIHRARRDDRESIPRGLIRLAVAVGLILKERPMVTTKDPGVS